MRTLYGMLLLLLSAGALGQTNNISDYWVTGDGEKVRRKDRTHWTRTTPNSNWDNVANPAQDTVRLFAARNEVVAFQLHLLSGATPISDLNVKFDTLASGANRIHNAGWSGFTYSDTDPVKATHIFNTAGHNIELFTIAYTESLKCRSRCSGTFITCPGKPLSPGISWSNGVWASNQYSDTAYGGQIPMALIPKEASVKGTTTRYGGMPMAVPANVVQGVWCDVYVPRTTPAGYYTGFLRIYQGKDITVNTHNIPVKLQVFDVAISDTVFLPMWGPLNASFDKRYYDLSSTNVWWGSGSIDGDATFWGYVDKYMKFFHRHLLTATFPLKPETFGNHMIPYFKGYAYTASNPYGGTYGGWGENTGDRIYSIGTYDQGNATSYYNDASGTKDWGGSNMSGFGPPHSQSSYWEAADDWAAVMLVNGIDTSNSYWHFFKYLIDEPRDPTDVYPVETPAKWLKTNPGMGKCIRSFDTHYIMDYSAGRYGDPSYGTYYASDTLTPMYKMNRYLDWIAISGHAGQWVSGMGRNGYIRDAVKYWRSKGKKMMVTSGGWPSAGQAMMADQPMIAQRVTQWIAMLYNIDAIFLWMTDYLPHEVGFNNNTQRDYWKMNDFNLRSGGFLGFDIIDATNATPIELTLNTSIATGNYTAMYSAGDPRRVWVVDVGGNTAANGLRYAWQQNGKITLWNNYRNGLVVTDVDPVTDYITFSTAHPFSVGSRIYISGTDDDAASGDGNHTITQIISSYTVKVGTNISLPSEAGSCNGVYSPISGNGSYTSGGYIRPQEGSGAVAQGTIVFDGEDKIFPTSSKGVKGPIATVMMKNLRRGNLDYNLYYQARRSLGWDAIKGTIWQAMPQAADSFAGSYISAGESNYPYSISGDTYEQVRIELLRKLAGVSTGTGIPPSIADYNVTPPSGTGETIVTIQYVCQNADSVKLNGVKLASATAATIYDTITTTTIFTLVAYGDGYTASSSKTVQIESTPTVELIVNGSFEREGGWTYAASGHIGNSWTRVTSGSPPDSTYQWRWVSGSIPGLWNQTYQSSANVFSMTEGVSYRFHMHAYNSAGGDLWVRILRYPSYIVGLNMHFSLNAGEWKAIDTVVSPKFTASDFYMQFLGTDGSGEEYLPASSTTYLDGISLSRLELPEVGVPVVTYPTNNETEVDSPFVAIWSHVGGASSYHYMIDDTTLWDTPVVEDTITGTGATIYGLSRGENYWIKVRALAAGLASNWSDSIAFTMVSVIPGSSPNATEPVNGSRGNVLHTTFTWTTVPGATSYEVQISGYADFSDTLFQFSSQDNDLTSGEDYASPFLSYSTDYYWRVRAKNLAGSTAWSSVATFRTGSRRGVRTDKML